MRLFIAIDLNFSMKEELIYLAKQIKINSDRCSLTNEDNLHLTMAFIGEYDDPKKVISALGNISFNEFDIALSHIGYFDRRGEMLVYAALEKNKELSSLRNKIASALKNESINFDNKKFLPHITLARRVTGTDKEDIDRIKPEKIKMTVNEFHLYSSDLSGKRPVYTILSSFKAI